MSYRTRSKGLSSVGVRESPEEFSAKSVDLEETRTRETEGSPSSVTLVDTRIELEIDQLRRNLEELHEITKTSGKLSPCSAKSGREAARMNYQEGAVRPVAKTKFRTPPTFHGKEDEDAVAWIDRYERVGRYNHWTEDDLHGNFEMFLDGSARKWFVYLESRDKVPEEWESVASSTELKELFLK